MTRDEIGAQWVESPCGTPWLFKHAEEACAAYNRQMAAATDRPRRGMGEVTTENLWRMAAAVVFMGVGFVLVSGRLERAQEKRRRRR